MARLRITHARGSSVSCAEHEPDATGNDLVCPLCNWRFHGESYVWAMVEGVRMRLV